MNLREHSDLRWDIEEDTIIFEELKRLITHLQWFKKFVSEINSELAD